MDKASRRAARDAFVKQKTVMGIFAVRCHPTGRVWVGKSRNLGAVRNRFAFSVKTDPVLNRQMCNDWNTHGEDQMEIEILEELDEETLPAFIDSELKEKLTVWQKELGADLV